MSFRDLLVCLDPHDLTAVRHVSEFAVNLSSLLDAQLCGLIIEEQVLEPRDTVDRVVTEHLIREDNEHQKAAAEARKIFQAAAQQAGIRYDIFAKPFNQAKLPTIVAEVARLFDCSIVPAMSKSSELGMAVIEELIFGSGRPLILVPAHEQSKFSSDHVVVAWDGSQPAARAVHDAIPILQQAALTEIITVDEEKHSYGVSSGDDLVKHLKSHNIRARWRGLAHEGGALGEQLMTAAQRADAGMLVMGAYGHSRVRQIIFGGATRSVISRPLLPVLLSN
jgi:nucleotide-binding universal stress UspA family protein